MKPKSLKQGKHYSALPKVCIYITHIFDNQFFQCLTPRNGANHTIHFYTVSSKEIKNNINTWKLSFSDDFLSQIIENAIF